MPQWVIFGVGVWFKDILWVYSYSWTTFIFYAPLVSDFFVDLILGSFMAFWGPMGLFFWLGKGSKDVLGAAHIIHQLLFSRNGSIWALIYILNVLTHFWKFLKKIWRQTDRPTDRQTYRHTGPTYKGHYSWPTIFGHIHIDRKLLFSMLLWLLTFIVDLILGSFMAFWGPMGLFF